MPIETLDFEEPIAVLLKEIEALSMLPVTAERQRSIDSLVTRIDSIRLDIYRTLTPWQRVQVARHPSRPTVLDYVNRLFTDFTEISGDRRFADDHAIVYRLRADTWDGVADVHESKAAKMYLAEFDAAWIAAAPDFSLRVARR